MILTKNLIKLVEIATFCKMNSSDISDVVTDSVICSQQVPDPETTRSQLVSALSDAMFVSPGVHSAGTFARRRNNTFFFQFSHQTKSGMYAEVKQSRESRDLNDFYLGIIANSGQLTIPSYNSNTKLNGFPLNFLSFPNQICRKTSATCSAVQSKFYSNVLLL